MFKRLLAGLLAAILLAPAAHAQLILDQEFTHACDELTAPLRATLAPRKAVHYVLVVNPEINAFVTGENIVYIHSGLIAQAKSAAELQGVLAHELGHIHANHILQAQGNMRQAGVGAIAGAVLGMGAAMAGAPQVGSAIAIGSQAGAISNLLAHTRTQEQEADTYAISALHAAGYSAQGMVGMFTTLRTQSQLSYDAPPPWLVTHPLPPQRIATLQRAVEIEKSGLIQNPTINFERLKAKVAALANPPGSTLRSYPGNSATARYARAMALAAQGKLADASQLAAMLRQEDPSDPFYKELTARIALEQGNLAQAETLLAELVQTNPGALLFRYQYAEVLRAQNKPQQALTQYERITRDWPAWSEAWQGLGLTYGQTGKLTQSHLALAEAAIAANDAAAAKQSLALAKTYLKKTPSADNQVWVESLEARLK